MSKAEQRKFDQLRADWEAVSNSIKSAEVDIAAVDARISAGRRVARMAHRGSRLANVLGHPPTLDEELAFVLGKIEGANSAL